MTLQSVGSSELCSVVLDAMFSWCPPTPMALTIFLFPLLWGFLTPGVGEAGLYGDPHLGLCVPELSPSV